MLDDLSLFNPTGVDVQPHDFEKFERQIEIKWEEERKSVHRKKNSFFGGSTKCERRGRKYMFTSYLLRHWLRHLLRHLLRYRPFVVIFQLNTLLILQIAGNTRSFSKLLQTFLLLQIHEIWYGGQRDMANATGKVSTHSIYLFLFYNNMQQNPVQIWDIAANTSFFSKLLQTFWLMQIYAIL